MNRIGSDLTAIQKSLTRRHIIWRIALAGIGLILFAFVAMSEGILSSFAGMGHDQKNSSDPLWQDVAESSIVVQGRRETIPRAYRNVRLNQSALRSLLATVPMELTQAAEDTPVELTLPLPDGSFGKFRIVESPIMEPELAAQLPEIRNYAGQGIDDRSATMRFNITPDGFHAFIISSAGTISIVPYSRNDTTHYISYFQRESPEEQSLLNCLTDDSAQLPSSPQAPIAPPLSFDHAGTRRAYSFAAAATGEFTTQNGGFNSAQAAINTVMSGVNAIYERELSIRLVLVINNSIIYTNGATDPYTSGDRGRLVDENQSNLNNVIGADNYQVGIVFDATDSSGFAIGRSKFIGEVCQNDRKGAATTGGTFVSLAAHEIGHQFGARHIFNNGSTGSCGGLDGSASQRDTLSAFEPGSGSTIMSYAGTCLSGDLQSGRDSYFNVANLDQIIQYVSSGSGSGCSLDFISGNRAPAISLPEGTQFNIPRQTPFRLNMTATDPDGDAVTVAWEEHELGNASPPETDDGARPIFRSYLPSASGTRLFPKLEYILNNSNDPPFFISCSGGPGSGCIPGERLPTTSRFLLFQGTARDNHVQVGAINGGVSTRPVLLNVDANSGPFIVSQISALWAQGSVQTVSWNVAATNTAPINCSAVKISLSTDGGQTFPIVLADNTPNDGSQNITVPTVITTTARVKVEAVGNIFFDIFDSDITIKRVSVRNTDDSGEGSLRQAIIDANNVPGLTEIDFEIPGSGVRTINLNTELPLITDPIVIDGLSQGGAGYTGPPLIELRGLLISEPDASGLKIAAGNSTVTGLAINLFSGDGIILQTLGGNLIKNCYIGTNAAGTIVVTNRFNGIFIDNSPNNNIGVGAIALFPGNIISGNDVGILISGTNAFGNKVQNNYIGTNRSGAALGNASAGIRIDSATDNLIGGTDSNNGLSFSVGNVISGNGPGGGADGIEVMDGSAGTVIQGNTIGLNATGAAALRNSRFGISVNNAPTVQIGGAIAAARNIISGNGSYGISLKGNTTGTRIQGNYVGTNVNGAAAVPNGTYDIYVESGSNQIGGTVASSGNVLAGFTSGAGRCIYLLGSGATNNIIQGNYIGTDKTGSVALNSAGIGIELLRANNNVIGGNTAAARNLISGNSTGLVIGDGIGNAVLGNYIGTNAAGNAALGNAGVAIQIDSASNNAIGGNVAGVGNVISGNGGGVVISGSGTSSGNLVQGNFIGTNAAGTAALGNTGRGVTISPTTGMNNIVGGSSPGARNIISANGGGGVRIGGGTGTMVQGNFIGTDITGTVNLGNGKQDGISGIELAAGSANVIGGSSAGEGNIIAFNGCSPCSFTTRSGSGIFVFGGSSGNRIRGNSIFANAELAINLNGGTENEFRTTSNDSCDADTGANNLQNFPVLSSAVNTGQNPAIQGTLNTTAGGAFTIDFYSNPACDASGNGEGKTYLGSTAVNTEAGCNTPINFTLPVSVPGGQFVTATATDFLGNTSEVSSCVAVLSSIPTPAGNNVVVKSSGVTINFPVVTAAGNTSITSIDPGSAGSLPSGYSLCEGCPAFDVTTTASYTPPVGVCIDAPAGLDQQTFNSLKLLHGENGVLVDRTTGRQTDPQTGVRSVCGSVNSLSPFLIAQGPAPSPTPTPTPTPLVSNLQFNASNYNGAEDCSATMITVTRTGDSSSAVSVDYATSDGSALQKADYTIALGTLNFASGETSRSFLVLITEDSYVEGTETATITLSNPTGGAALGSPNTATLTILDDAAEAAVNPIDLAGSYVCQHYHNFLNREPDAAGLDFWINEITSCGTDPPCIERKRINVSAAYFLSIEFQQTGYLVYRFYNATLNRSSGLPRYLEFLRNTQTVSRGVVVLAPGWEAQLEANKVAFAREFVARGEFTALYPLSQTPTQYVDALFAHAGVTPSAAERQAAIDEFAGAVTSADAAARGRVLRRVAENQTLFQREFNRAFVLMQYFGYLRRNPDDLPDSNLDGYNFWLGKLNQFNGDFIAAEMVKAFITSGEYRQRFGP